MLKRAIFPTLVLFLIFIGLISTLASEKPSEVISVHFSPNGSCTDAIVDCLDKATNSVYVQAYSFTSAPIEVET